MSQSQKRKTVSAAAVRFEHGPYGEIFPPPLIAGVDREEALEKLAADSAALGSPITSMPTRGKSLDGMYRLAVLYAHQLRLRQALAGKMPDDPDAADLYRAITVEGQPMSLRPMGLEYLVFHMFAPVLQRVGEKKWRVGLEGRGKTVVIEAGPEEAVEKAQQIFVALSETDDEKWAERINEVLKQIPRLLYHELWAFLYHKTGIWNRGGGFGLVALRGHGTCELHMPSGQRILTTTRVRAVHVCDALARRAEVKIDVPRPDDVIDWMQEEGVPEARQAEPNVLLIGDGNKVTWQKQGGAPRAYVSLQGGAARCILVVDRRGDVKLHPVKRGNRPDTRKRVGSTSLGPHIQRWVSDEGGRRALSMWAVKSAMSSKHLAAKAA